MIFGRVKIGRASLEKEALLCEMYFNNSLFGCVRFLLWSCHFMAWWVVDKPQSIRFHYVRLVVDIGPDSANFQLE